MVAVEAVDPPAEQEAGLDPGLHPPGERQQPGVAGGRDQAWRPGVATQVEDVDAVRRQPRGVALRVGEDAAPPDRADQAHPWVEPAPGRQADGVGVAQPEPVEGLLAEGGGHPHHLVDRPGVLHVEGQLEPRPAGAVQVVEGGDVRGELVTGHPADGRGPPAPADHAVVVEDRHAVRRQPHVALEPARAHAAGQHERLEGVLGSVGAGAPVGEPDREQGSAGWAHRPILSTRHRRHTWAIWPLCPAPRRADALKVMVLDREGGS